MNRIMILVLISLFFIFSCTPKQIDDDIIIDDSLLTTDTTDIDTIEDIDVSELVDLRTVYFDYNSFDIKSSYQSVMLHNAQELQTYPSLKVRLEGHCDERGTLEYNLALGQKRADACREYLIHYGIAPDRIMTLTYGEEMPVSLGHSESHWQKNRRVEFKIIEN